MPRPPATAPPHARRRRARKARGFTLVEGIVSAVLLVLAATAMATLYYAGMQATQAQILTTQIDSNLRSQMEYLLAYHFDQLVPGDYSAAIKIGSQDYTTSWTISAAPFAPASDAKEIAVRIAGRDLRTIVKAPSE